MTQSKHTPTPWAIEHNNENTIVPLSSASVIWIAQANHDNRFSKADAAFIVKAVNCHDELVRALASLLLVLPNEIQGHISGHIRAAGVALENAGVKAL